MEPRDVIAMLLAEPTRLKGREWVIDHEFDLLALWDAAQRAWPYLKDASDEPNPKDDLWDVLTHLKGKKAQ